MMGPDTPATFTPRGGSKGLIFDQIEAFLHMQSIGADLVDAFVTCISGRRMTEDLAAQCIQTYWYRYQSLSDYQNSRGAAITIQVLSALVCSACGRAYELCTQGSPS